MATFERFSMSGISRRRILGGIALGAAGTVIPVRFAFAQDATPAAGEAVEVACAEPFNKDALAGVKMVTDGGKITVAIVPKLVHPFFEDTRIGAETAAGESGVEFQWVAPQTGDPAIQVKMIEDLVSKQVNAIVISPNDPASVEPVIADAMSKGILVMTFDSDSPDSDRVMYIGTDNQTAGAVMGETMKELLGGKGKVGIITGGLGALNLNQRIDGFKSTIGADIEIVDTVATDDDLQKALGVSEALMRAHPDLNGVACVSATGGPTLAQVIRGPEFEGRDVKIVAFDDLEETVRGIEDGVIAATMVQRPNKMGVLSIQTAKDIVTGALVPECAIIDTGVTVVTKENLTSYTK